jgi:hypothetical protein
MVLREELAIPNLTTSYLGRPAFDVQTICPRYVIPGIKLTEGALLV